MGRDPTTSANVAGQFRRQAARPRVRLVKIDEEARQRRQSVSFAGILEVDGTVDARSGATAMSASSVARMGSKLLSSRFPWPDAPHPPAPSARRAAAHAGLVVGRDRQGIALEGLAALGSDPHHQADRTTAFRRYARKSFDGEDVDRRPARSSFSSSLHVLCRTPSEATRGQAWSNCLRIGAPKQRTKSDGMPSQRISPSNSASFIADQSSSLLRTIRRFRRSPLAVFLALRSRSNSLQPKWSSRRLICWLTAAWVGSRTRAELVMPSIVDHGKKGAQETNVDGMGHKQVSR